MTAWLTVFAGPSLAARLLDGVAWHGPAAAGDLLRLASGPPHSVLLIDGLFETVRAPWHKEILVLIALGFEVCGAASLGALRAAELAVHGMRPIGRVAQAYFDGRIIGDDEVAVLHAPTSLGYRALTVAQVDVRATLCAAVRARRLAPQAAREVRAGARAIFYKDRTWERVSQVAVAALGMADAAPFIDWLPRGAIDCKRIDAERALGILVAEGETMSISRRDPPPETVFLSRLRAVVSMAASRSPAP